MFEFGQTRRQFGAIGHYKLGGGRGCRRPHVGREIGQCDVHLMPDATHDRDRMAYHSPDNALVVERPQVFERATATSEDHDGGRLLGTPGGAALVAPSSQSIQCRDDAQGRSVALNLA
jgi:hypothetical protein